MLNILITLGPIVGERGTLSKFSKQVFEENKRKWQ